MNLEYYKENRERLISEIKRKMPNTQNSYILLKGSFNYPQNDADTSYAPKYDFNIQFFFGIQQMDVDACIEYPSGKTFFIQPDLDPMDYYEKSMTKKTAQEVYGVDEFYFYSKFKEFLNQQKQDNKIDKIFRCKGIDSYTQQWNNFYNEDIVIDLMDYLDDNLIYPIINTLRCLKSEKEIKLFKDAVQISSKAHVECMKICRAYLYEYQLASYFLLNFSSQKAEDNAYPSIVGANRNGSYLHYMVNDDVLKDGYLLLTDMGCKKMGLCSDITCTYPINGKFNKKQKQIYELVLKAQREAIKGLKPGVNYGDLQNLSFNIILQGLIDLGLLIGDKQEMFDKLVHKIFMPHGLGHFIGYETHDVGIQKDSTGDIEEDKKFKFLTECQLMEGMALTVEPGIYFIDNLIEQSKEQEINKYMNYEVIKQYRDEIGGVRIEDDLIITKDSYENFTECPRTVEEIEKCMRGENWKNQKIYLQNYYQKRKKQKCQIIKIEQNIKEKKIEKMYEESVFKNLIKRFLLQFFLQEQYLFS